MYTLSLRKVAKSFVNIVPKNKERPLKNHPGRLWALSSH
jgi:hypothetical protein